MNHKGALQAAWVAYFGETTLEEWNEFFDEQHVAFAEELGVGIQAYLRFLASEHEGEPDPYADSAALLLAEIIKPEQ